jgi:hypothetical protein
MEHYDVKAPRRNNDVRCLFLFISVRFRGSMYRHFDFQRIRIKEGLSPVAPSAWRALIGCSENAGTSDTRHSGYSGAPFLRAILGVTGLPV